MSMPSAFRRILASTAICLAASLVLVFGWAGFQLWSAQVHLLGLNGQVCTCELGDIRQDNDGNFHIYMPDAIGQELYVVPDSLRDKAIDAEAYILPWFGRQHTKVNESGYAIVKKTP